MQPVSDDGRGPEGLHQLDLLGRTGLDSRARRHEEGAGPVGHGLSHIMAAVDHSVAVDRVDDVARAQSLPTIDAGQKQVLELTALGPEQQDLGLSGGARGGVEDDGRALVGGVAFEAGEVAEWRRNLQRLHDVGLVEAGQVRQVVEALDIALGDAGGAPQTAIEGGPPRAGDAAGEQRLLSGAQLVAAYGGHQPGEGIPDGVITGDGGEIDLVPVSAVGVGHRRAPRRERIAAASGRVSNRSMASARAAAFAPMPPKSRQVACLARCWSRVRGCSGDPS